MRQVRPLLLMILTAAILALTGCDRLLPVGSREVGRDASREIGGPADHRVEGGANPASDRRVQRGADGARDRQVERGPAASCAGLPPGTDCFLPSAPAECDGAGKCVECLLLGSQCGTVTPADCCDGLACMGSRATPGFDTCGGI